MRKIFSTWTCWLDNNSWLKKYVKNVVVGDVLWKYFDEVYLKFLKQNLFLDDNRVKRQKTITHCSMCFKHWNLSHLKRKTENCWCLESHAGCASAKTLFHAGFEGENITNFVRKKIMFLFRLRRGSWNKNHKSLQLNGL